jgi:hypothetical protein
MFVIGLHWNIIQSVRREEGGEAGDKDPIWFTVAERTVALTDRH